MFDSIEIEKFLLMNKGAKATRRVWNNKNNYIYLEEFDHKNIIESNKNILLTEDRKFKYMIHINGEDLEYFPSGVLELFAIDWILI